MTSSISTYQTFLKNHSFRYIITVCLCSIAFTFVLAQSPSSDNMRFGKITKEQGLSHNTISRIAQDTKGFMWFGSYVGINRFDGKNVRVFQHDTSDTTSISDNTVWSICATKDDAVWIGTVNGLNRYSYETDEFERFFLVGNTGNIATCNYIFEDQDNTIWVTTAGNGLFKIRKTGTNKTGAIQWDIKNYIHDSNNNSLAHNYVFCIAQHPKYPHILWLSTQEGLVKMDTQNEIFTNYKQPSNVSNTKDKSTLSNIAFDKSGLLWYGTSSTGIG